MGAGRGVITFDWSREYSLCLIGTEWPVGIMKHPVEPCDLYALRTHST